MRRYRQAIDIRNIRYSLIDTGTGLIHPEIFPVEFKPIISLMHKDIRDIQNECIDAIYIDQGRLFIRTNLGNSELMLRLYIPFWDMNHSEHHAIVVLAVVFAHRRQGYMTELHKRLVNIVNKKPDLDAIIIESVVTPEMHAWCKKNNFIPMKYAMGLYYKIIK